MSKTDYTIPVLNHGFVKLLNISSAVPRPDQDFSAKDIDPAICARISFDKFLSENRPEEVDLHLVKYLMEHKHNTPVEMTEVWLEMKLPIFVARQFVRHRTACINEVSARYSELPAEWYIPEVVGARPTNGMKQGQEDTLSHREQQAFRDALNTQCGISYHNYERFLRSGVAPEHARLFLHVNHFTHWLWKQDLHNLLHFLRLRMDSHAQVEARAYACAIQELLSRVLPKTMAAFSGQNITS